MKGLEHQAKSGLLGAGKLLEGSEQSGYWIELT